MSRSVRLLTGVLVAGALLTGCAGAIPDAYVIEHDPGHVEEVPGSDVPAVVVTRAAAGRLEIRTSPVQQARDGLAVPSAAVFVDPEGGWWVYTSGSERFSYMRHEIEVLRERNGRTVLSAGPEVGTQVVTRGVAELYGIESGIGH